MEWYCTVDAIQAIPQPLFWLGWALVTIILMRVWPEGHWLAYTILPLAGEVGSGIWTWAPGW